MFSEFLSGDALAPNAENMSRCFFKGRFKCRLLVMRVAPVEGVGGAAEEEAVVGEEGKAAVVAGEEAAEAAPDQGGSPAKRRKRPWRRGGMRPRASDCATPL